MAEITNGANGAFSGKVGSVIGSKWKDINYIRGISKRSSKAPSEAQLIQQAKFGLIVNFLSPIRALLDNGFKDTGRASGYHLAVNHNLANAVAGTYPEFAIDFTQIAISKGSLISYGEQASISEGLLTFTWPEVPENAINSFASDKASILVYNASKNIHMASSGVERSALSAEMAIPPAFAGDTLQAYIFFTSLKGKTSNSTYVGSFVAL